MAIIVLLVGGSSLNLKTWYRDSFVKAGVAPQFAELLLSPVKFGYYSGIIGGVLVDMVTPWKSFLLISFVAFCSIEILATIALSDFSFIYCVISTVFLFLTGLCGSVATFCAIVATLRNFTPKYSTLILLILVTYMKLTNEWDESVRKGAFGQFSNATYIYVSGFMVAGVYFIAVFI